MSELPEENGDDLRAQEERDRADQLELISETRGVLRRGGLILAAFIALTGWYLSREWGVWFLIGGVALAALTGGALALTGSLGGLIAKKYIDAKNGAKKK